MTEKIKHGLTEWWPRTKISEASQQDPIFLIQEIPKSHIPLKATNKTSPQLFPISNQFEAAGKKEGRNKQGKRDSSKTHLKASTRRTRDGLLLVSVPVRLVSGLARRCQALRSLPGHPLSLSLSLPVPVPVPRSTLLVRRFWVFCRAVGEAFVPLLW